MSRDFSLLARRLFFLLLFFGLTGMSRVYSPAAHAQANLVVTLTVSPSTVSENAGTRAALGTVLLNQALTSDLEVTLVNGDATELTMPAKVTVPAGQVAVTFNIDAVDDTEADGTQYVAINGTVAEGVVIGLTVPVLDDESALKLTITPDTVSESSGPTAASGTITRLPASSTDELTVNVTSSAPDLVTLPTTVTIPAGATSVTFPIGITNNDESTGNVDVTIGVSKPNSTDPAVTGRLTVIDDESLLTITVAKTTLSETAGLRATTATISRSEEATEGEVGVTLASSDTSEILIPPYVVIPAGQTSVEVPVGVNDDVEADGTQVAKLTASAVNFTSGGVEITVTDNETPTLRLEIYGTGVNEGSGNRALIGVIHRNTSVRESLSVALRSSDTSEITVPATVLIPRGAESVTFPIGAPQDSIVDPVQTVTITASRSGFQSSSATTRVLDDEGPSLRMRLEDATVTDIKEADDPVEIKVTRFNTSLASPLTVDISSSNANFVKPQSASVTIPAGLASTTFFVEIGDNTIPDDVQWATLTATTGSFRPGVVSLVVNDNEDPAILDFKVDAPKQIVPIPLPLPSPLPTPRYEPTVSEIGGPSATLATISRNTATTSDVVVKLESGLPGAMRVPEVVIIPFGKTSVTFPLSAVDDLVDCAAPDPTLADLRAEVAGFESGAVTVQVLDNEPCYPGRALTVSIDKDDIIENSGPRAATVTVTRYDPEEDLYDLRVGLSTSAPDSATVQTPIIIPKGRSFVKVPLSAIDNTEAGGCVSVTVTPTAEVFIDPSNGQELDPLEVGFKSPYKIYTDSVRILDNESPISDLTVRPGVFRENGSEGVATGLVTRAGDDLNTDITVNLRSSDETEVTVPSTVRIPAGQRSASFAVTSVLDGLDDDTQKAQIIASVDCFTLEQKAEVSVLDIDVPTLSLKVQVSVLEKAGVNAGLGSVTRNTPTDQPLIVKLTTSEPLSVTVPAEVTIPAKQRSVAFKIGVVNDNQVLGDRRVQIIASRAGFRSSSLPVLVREDDAPQLAVTINPARVSEAAGANATTGTVTRNTTTRNALTVGLVSNIGGATVPLRVTIPAGAVSATFPIGVIDDGVKTAPRTAIITASASRFRNGSASLTITESTKLVGQNAAKLSDAVARSADGIVQLRFRTALRAGDAGRYAVSVNGHAADVEAVSYQAADGVVTLSLRVDALRAGDHVSVEWNNLLDAAGNVLNGGTTELTAR